MKRFVSQYLVSLCLLFVLVGIALILGGLPGIAAIASLSLFGLLTRNAVFAQIMWEVSDLEEYVLQSVKTLWIVGLGFVASTLLASILSPTVILPLLILAEIALTVLIFSRVGIFILDMGISEFVTSAVTSLNSQSARILGIWIVIQVIGIAALVAAGLPLFAVTMCIMLGLYVLALFRNILGDDIVDSFIRQEIIARWTTRGLALDAILSLSVLKAVPLVHDLGRAFIIVQLFMLVIVASKFFWRLSHPEESNPVLHVEFIGYLNMNDVD